jgi:LPXTG-motif cell wall-anchored protein
MGTRLHTSTSTTRTFYRAILPLIVALSLLASQLTPFGALPAEADVVGAGTDSLGFEIDGNYTVDTGGNSDWATRPYLSIVDSTSPHMVFTGGTKEGDRAGWSVTTGNAPPKADVLRLYADVEQDGSAAWLRLGAERDSGNGDTWVSFEMNQANGGDTVPGTTVPSTPADGDLLVTFQFPGNVGDAPVVRVDQWTGGGWSSVAVTAYGAVNSSTIDNLSGQSVDAREFLELSVDVSFLFGPDAPCRSFANSWARSRSSDSGPTSQLQDFIAPFPFGFDTCAGVTLRKENTDGVGQSGVEFELYAGDEVTGTPVATCTTGEGGSCTAISGLEPGEYTAYEVAPPVGYRFSEEGRSQTFTLGRSATDTIVFTNPPITYLIEVTPDDDTNAVGYTHDFTAKLTADFVFDDETGEYEESDEPDIPLAGETVDLGWDGPGSSAIVAIDGVELDPAATTTTCTTDGDGECLVTVLSDEVGSGTLTATYDTPFGGAAASDPANSTDGGYAGSISDSGAKSWIGYVAELEGDFHNPLGVDHTFTATVEQVNADGSRTAAADVEVTFDWDGPAGSALVSDTCTTGASGTCDVTVTSPTGPGTGTLTITQVEGEIVEGEDLTIEYEGDDAPSATKTWWDYRATVEADAVNPISEDHTFTITVETNDGSGWTAAEDGTTVDFAWTGTGTVDREDCTDPGTVDGECSVTVTSDEKGTGTITVTGITTTLGGYNLEDDVEQPFDVEVDEVSATKSWVDWLVDITFDAENPAGESHTFTVEVKVWDPVLEIYQPVPDGTTLTLAYSDDTLVDDDESCTLDGTVDGFCTITASSDAAAALTVTVEGIAGMELDGHPDGTASFTFPVDGRASSTKTWIEYRIVGDDDAYNVVGDPHDFTLRAEERRPGGDWEPLAGVTLDLSLDTDIDAGIDASDCTETGTDENGECTVTVSSDVPGSATVTADAINGIDLLDGEAAGSTTSWDVSVAEATQTKHWIDIELVKTALIDEDDDGFKSVTYSTDPDVDPPVITYEYTITNPSSVPLTVTSLEDDVLGTITLPDPLVLGPGESATVTADHEVTREDADEGSIYNIAVVTAQAEDGTEVSAADDEEVFVVMVFASGSIDLIKTALVDRDAEGNKTFDVAEGETAVVTYRYRITNNGNVPLSDLWLLDDKIGDIPLPDVTLEPGDTLTVDADYTVTAADLAAGEVENIAIVTGFTADGVEVTDWDDEIVFPVEVLDVVIAKPLPRTGADTSLLLTLGLLMAALGAAALLMTPRRRRQQ